MRHLSFALILSAAVFFSTPGAAQGWRLGNSENSQIDQDVRQLDRQISRAENRRAISRREASSLRREAGEVERLHRRYARGGFSRQEVSALERSINQVRARLRLAKRNWDGR